MALIHEQVALVSQISPQLADNVVLNGGYIDMSKIERVQFILSVGSSDCDVTLTLREARDTSGTDERAIAGKTVTLTGSDDNKQAIVEVSGADMNSPNASTDQPGFRYFRPRLTVADGAAGAYVSLVALGRWRIQSGHGVSERLASVAQLVA